MTMPATYIQATTVIESPQKPRFYNLFWYAPSGTITIPAIQTYLDNMANLVAGQILGPMAAVMTTVTQLVGVHCKMKYQGQFYESIGVSGSLTGTVTGDECPDWTAAVIQKRTSTAGRSGRGRWYVGPVPELFTDENRLTDAGYTAYEDLGDAWVDSITNEDDTWIAQMHSEKNQVLHPIIARHVLTQLGTIMGRKSHSLV